MSQEEDHVDKPRGPMWDASWGSHVGCQDNHVDKATGTAMRDESWEAHVG